MLINENKPIYDSPSAEVFYFEAIDNICTSSAKTNDPEDWGNGEDNWF